jgi:hypothetical protein
VPNNFTFTHTICEIDASDRRLFSYIPVKKHFHKCTVALKHSLDEGVVISSLKEEGIDQYGSKIGDIWSPVLHDQHPTKVLLGRRCISHQFETNA